MSMKVEVLWVNMADADNVLVLDGNVSDDTPFSTIEKHAIDGTPKGFCLSRINMPEYSMIYRGKSKIMISNG